MSVLTNPLFLSVLMLVVVVFVAAIQSGRHY